MEIADFFDLKLSFPVNQVPTKYADNPDNANLVINLMFIWLDLEEIDNHLILPKSRSLSDYTPLTVDIFIIEKYIQNK